MKRTFCLMATMAFFAIPPSAHAEPLKNIRLHYIQNYVEEAAAVERLEPALLKAVIQVESHFNHRAVSQAGAKGLMQLMPGTAAKLGDMRALDQRNPRANILIGAHYLRGLINEFHGDLRLAIAAYNAGPGAVKKYKGIPPYAETKDYVQKVLSSLKKERRIALNAGVSSR